MAVGMNHKTSIHEPPLDELFADPIIQLLMKQDGVMERDLHPMLERLAERIAHKPSMCMQSV